jgi:hypothetical protein
VFSQNIVKNSTLEGGGSRHKNILFSDPTRLSLQILELPEFSIKRVILNKHYQSMFQLESSVFFFPPKENGINFS